MDKLRILFVVISGTVLLAACGGKLSDDPVQSVQSPPLNPAASITNAGTVYANDLTFYDASPNGRVITSPIMSTVQIGPNPIADGTIVHVFGHAWQTGTLDTNLKFA